MLKVLVMSKVHTMLEFARARRCFDIYVTPCTECEMNGPAQRQSNVI